MVSSVERSNEAEMWDMLTALVRKLSTRRNPGGRGVTICDFIRSGIPGRVKIALMLLTGQIRRRRK